MSDGPLKADGYDDCIIGLCRRFNDVFLVYDRAKVIAKLVAGGLTEEEAEEHFEFNIAGAWVGASTPGFVEAQPLFTCSLCRELFAGGGWTDEEAAAEAKRNFGEGIDVSNCDIVCDDCYEKIMGQEAGRP